MWARILRDLQPSKKQLKERIMNIKKFAYWWANCETYNEKKEWLKNLERNVEDTLFVIIVFGAAFLCCTVKCIMEF